MKVVTIKNDFVCLCSIELEDVMLRKALFSILLIDFVFILWVICKFIFLRSVFNCSETKFLAII